MKSDDKTIGYLEEKRKQKATREAAEAIIENLGAPPVEMLSEITGEAPDQVCEAMVEAVRRQCRHQPSVWGRCTKECFQGLHNVYLFFSQRPQWALAVIAIVIALVVVPHRGPGTVTQQDMVDMQLELRMGDDDIGLYLDLIG